ncbi:uncharacterized protein LOC130783071 [Actinidia eriantha]|uniref:uncharacterized protein LOC130783071 n=1 Tax=Actinidia eriantha TaxID=165200 RepID=UPI002587DA62|nr:uncharacterized protein LOC130783071 [Actinidia eriantha]
MNGNKKMGSSPSSSFTSDLFDSNESSASSSSGIYRSIFPLRPRYWEESLCALRRLRRSKTMLVRFGPPNLELLKTLSLGEVKVKIRAQRTRTSAIFIRNKKCNRVTSARRYIMAVKTSILILRKPRTLGTQRLITTGEKMIRAVLQEEIGGKGLCITKELTTCDVNFPYTYLRN